MTAPQPLLFLSHGGGPSFFISKHDRPSVEGMDKDSDARRYLESLVQTEKLRQPKAILVVSAHWEEEEFTVQTTGRPSLYYDYTAFPEETYHLQWPAPGAPEIAARVKEVLSQKGLKCLANNVRAYDHGVFIPLMLVYPEPTIPVFQLSLKSDQSVKDHLELGESLALLQKEDILIIGSGFTTHARAEVKDGQPAQWVLDFLAWLQPLLTDTDLSPQKRKEQLANCEKQPTFSQAHPTNDHFLPLLVVAAAAGYCPARILFSVVTATGLALQHYIFE